PISTLSIGLVDHEDVGNLHDARLERLHFVAGARHQRDDRDIGGPDDIDFVLPYADRLDDDQFSAGAVEHERGVAGGAGEAAKVTARPHAPDEAAAVLGVRLHAQAIAKPGAAAERARRIDGNHPDEALFFTDPGFSHGFGSIRTLSASRALRSLRSKSCDKPIHERALARARRAGNADQVRAAGAAEDRSHEIGALRILVLDQRDGPGDRGRTPGQHPLGQRRGHARDSSWRAMTSRWISLVPSPIVVSLTSRKYFSAG